MPFIKETLEWNGWQNVRERGSLAEDCMCPDIWVRGVSKTDKKLGVNRLY